MRPSTRAWERRRRCQRCPGARPRPGRIRLGRPAGAVGDRGTPARRGTPAAEQPGGPPWAGSESPPPAPGGPPWAASQPPPAPEPPPVARPPGRGGPGWPASTPRGGTPPASPPPPARRAAGHRSPSCRGRPASCRSAPRPAAGQDAGWQRLIHLRPQRLGTEHWQPTRDHRRPDPAPGNVHRPDHQGRLERVPGRAGEVPALRIARLPLVAADAHRRAGCSASTGSSGSP